MSTETTQTLKEKITEKIRAGKVCMHPRVRFVLKGVAVVTLSGIVFFTSLLILNFILFAIHVQGTHALLSFGLRGFGTFLFFFPWPLFVIDVVCIALLVHLVRSFRFGYRVPGLYIFGGLLGVVLVCGAVLEEYTEFNSALIERANRPDMPHVIPGMMNRLHTPPPPREGVCHCEVVGVTDAEHLTLRDHFSGKEFPAVITDRAHATTSSIEAGDRIFVAGDFDDGVFQIYGLKSGRGHRYEIELEPED